MGQSELKKYRMSSWYWGRFVQQVGEGWVDESGRAFPKNISVNDLESYDEALHGWHNSTEFQFNSQIHFQNISNQTELKPEHSWVWHTHGRRQYLGTQKLHLKPDCPALLKWKPARGLAKVLMMDQVSTKILSPEITCSICGAKNEK